jgi:hypothetical protein
MEPFITMFSTGIYILVLNINRVWLPRLFPGVVSGKKKWFPNYQKCNNWFGDAEFN